MSAWLRRQLRNNAGLLVVVAGMMVFRSAYADWNDIPSGSMEPTLLIGDRVLVDKHAYGWRVPFTRRVLAERSAPRVNEVVIFDSPVDERRWIKRVVAVAGDTVAARDGVLLRNGVAVGAAGRMTFGPVPVPPQHVFVMGDNRDNSLDSRFWGPLAAERITGRAERVALSFDGFAPRFERWGAALGSPP
jgi:signal peptidase I